MEVITQRLSIDKVSLPEWARDIANERGANNLVRKGFSFEDIKFVEGERASIHSITSTEMDRDQEIVIPKGLKLGNYDKNGKPVLWCHQYSTLPIGSCQWIKFDPATNTVLAKTRFSKHQLANDIYEHIKEHPLSASIGFIPIKWVSKDEYEDFDFKSYGLDPKIAGKASRIYTEAELLEYSLVPVPSNPSACQIAVSKGLISLDEIKNIGYVYEIIDPFKEGEKDGNEEQAKGEEQAEETKVEGSTSGDGEKGEVEFEIDVDTKLDTEEDKFCECEEPDFEDDECRGCGGRRKPRKPKKEFVEEIDDIGFGEVVNDEPNPLEIKIADEIKFPEIHSLFEELYRKSIDSEEKIIQLPNRKSLDITSLPSKAGLYHLKVFCEFLGCKVKNTYQNDFVIPWSLAASYLMAYKTCVKEFTYLDTRSFGYSDTEYPPSYEVMRVNSKIEEDFLISGCDFYEKDGIGIIAMFNPVWSGIAVSIFTSRKNAATNRKLISDMHKWVETESPLRGEKFALNGDFIETDENDTWDTVILDDDVQKSVKYAEKLINSKKKDFSGRGMLFIGPPGTGKTKTGRILMTQTDHTFIWASSKDFAKSYYATDVLAIAFKLAGQLAPTVLFLEDIDSWIHEKSGVIDLMKTELDGIKKNKGVITILTTNNPEKLPNALLDRPGRFHDVLSFDLPSESTRMKMIEQWIGDINSDTFKEILERTDGYSGAHMWELIEFAKTIAEDDGIDLDDALIESLRKLQQQRELISIIRGEASSKSNSLGDMVLKIDVDIEDAKKKVQEFTELVETKAGRILSKKTRETIQRAIDALNELITLADKPKDDDEDDDDEDEKKDLVLEDIELAEGDKIDSVVKEVLSDIFTTYDIDVKDFVDEAMKKMKGKMF